METQRISIKKLHPNTGQIPGLPANPRSWTKAEVQKIAKSLRETPELFEARPIIVFPQDGEFIILGGNLRFEGCKANKEKDAPCFIVPEGTPIDKLKEIVIKDNGSFGEWDFDALANEWDNLPLFDWGVPTWDTQDLPGVGATPQEVQEDDFDEEQDDIPVRCQKGDIWQLGNHRLMCGDSTEMADIALLMGGVKAQATITSPPYNATILDKEGDNNTKRKYLNDEDQKTSEDYLQFLGKNVGCLLEVSDEVFYNIGLVSGNKREIFQLVTQYIDYFKDMIYWEKSAAAPMIKDGVINNLVEFIICFGENNSRRFSHAQFSQGTYFNVIKGSGASSNEFASIHKATFPVYLPAEIIKNFTDDGAVVLDCFGGTGTTMIAAEQLGRTCYMMELEPRYCDVILARWEKLTGREAEKIE